jgi:hypothetical protein
MERSLCTRARDINQCRLTWIVHSTTIARSIYVTKRRKKADRMTFFLTERFFLCDKSLTL